VLAAVDTLHPAIEVPDSRYEDFAKVGAAQLIADNACAHHFVLGPATHADWRSRNLAEHAVTGNVSGKLRRDGKGANVLGDPRPAVTQFVSRHKLNEGTFPSLAVLIETFPSKSMNTVHSPRFPPPPSATPATTSTSPRRRCVFS
jgi:hypothetical protein